jgi:hypothetical protein
VDCPRACRAGTPATDPSVERRQVAAADGDQVLFDTKKGLQNGEYRIMYYAHESRPPTVRKLADDFRAFLDGLLDREEFRSEDE